MRLIIIGASRGVGRSLTELALTQGHQVTAFVRNPATLAINNSALKVVAGDVTNAALIEQSIKDHEMVFCTLGTDQRGPTTLYSTAARNIIQAMNAQGIRRLMFLSNYGVLGEKSANLRTASLLLIAKMVLRDSLKDHRRALDEMQRSNPDWIAVRPMGLTDAPHTGQYRIAVDGLPAGGTRIARADVADFMLKQTSSNEYLHQIPAIAY